MYIKSSCATSCSCGNGYDIGVFWDVGPYRLFVFTDIVKEHSLSLFKVESLSLDGGSTFF